METQTVATNIHSYWEEGLTLKRQWAALLATDGSLLSVTELVPCLDKNPADRRNPKNFLKSYVWSPPWEKFPARATYTPPFRTRGMTGNRLFNRTPSTKEMGYDWTRKLDADGGFHKSHYKGLRCKCQIDKIYESCCWSTLSFFVRCHEYYIFFGTDFAKKKRAGMGFWFPKPALIFYADICMMAKESTPSKTGRSLVAMLNSKWIGVKVVSNQRLYHL